MTPSRLVVALDVPDADVALRAAERLTGHADVLKVGLELFTAEGPALVRRLVSMGWGVFLDLKIHDIPATAGRTARVAADLGVELLTLHASGGRRMLEAAREGRGEGRLPRLLGVTVLTSQGPDDLRETGIDEGLAERVDRLCSLARRGGCDGVVASVREAAAIKAAHGDAFLVATPGIRPPGAGADDQTRVATPADAVRAGADYLVVGRPIMRAEDPVVAADAIRAQMDAATVA